MTTVASAQANRDSETGAQGRPTLLRRLTLMDSLMLIVGGVIGSAIFLTPRDIAAQLHSPRAFLGVWIAGGAISLLACFAFAELGAMYPHAGGQYVYLREAYGDVIGFLYGWMYFTVAGSGSLAALSVGFASYFGVLVPAVSTNRVVLTIGSWTLTRAQLVALAVIALLTWVNALGVKRAAAVQNVAAFLKYAAMAAFVVFGFAIGKGSWSHFSHLATAAPAVAASATSSNWSSLSAFGVALIAVFWAYDGWVYIGLAAGEVKNPARNLPLALIGGMVLVGVIYLSMNAAYLYGLSVPEIAAGEETTARAAANALFSPSIGVWISALVAVSCFGALSCAILSTARVSYAMANDGLFFRRMGTVHPVWRTPVFALITQGIWGGILALTGRYDQLFTYIMTMEVVSYGLAVAGLFILRRKYPDMPRPYRCTGYPWLPALYCVVAVVWALNTLWQRPMESAAGVGIVLLGLPAFFYWRRQSARV
jgi:basic amino acid/polyamine antiporter, APA family